VGLVGNANYFEMVDFVLGVVGLDISGDDGAVTGKWPWQSHESADRMMLNFRPLRVQSATSPARGAKGKKDKKESKRKNEKKAERKDNENKGRRFPIQVLVP